MPRRNVYWSALFAVIVIVLLGLPIAAGAQSASGITSIQDGATVSGKVEVSGTATAPVFWKWQLDLLPGKDPSAAIFLASDTRFGPFSYVLDTTRFPDGPHALRLRVVHPDGNYSESITRVTFANLAAKSSTPTRTPAPTTAPVVVVAGTLTPTATITLVTSIAASPMITSTAPKTAAPTPTVNGITSVQSGSTVSGTITVQGSANDPAFWKWQLDLLPGGDSNAAAFVALGTTTGRFSSVLDTTRYPNGKHVLRLRVVRSDGNYSEHLTPFSIANPIWAAPPNQMDANIRGG